MTHLTHALVILALPILTLLPACTESNAVPRKTRTVVQPPAAKVRPVVKPVATLKRFTSAAEFDGYLKRTREAWQRWITRSGRRSRRATAEAAASSGVLGALKGDGAPVDSITNNQESGVDEGDIVKAVGDYLVILRRGRLFSVRFREAGQPMLRPAGRCDAYPPKGSQGTWYDEMLVHGDRIIVIGFSYRVGGTEVGLFRLGPDGGITHESTHFLRSNDYYSSRNYASRLVDGKLVFYMPYFLQLQAQRPTLPAVADWDAAHPGVVRWDEILSRVDVYRPVQQTLQPTLHTVVQCDLNRPGLRCAARAVIGPYSRTFYVSSDAIYVWVGPGWDMQRQRASKEAVHLYRMPLRSSAVTAIRAHGNPVDQFSFKQGADGFLNVLVTASGSGDWMWNPEQSGKGKMELLRVPIAAFSDAPPLTPLQHYTSVPAPGPQGAIQNRFVGDWLLWGSGAGWWRKPKNGGTVYVTHVRQPRRVRQLTLDHGVDRIEALGRDAIVVGNGKQDLFFTSVDLSGEPAVRSTFVRPDAMQGETRSHGFFFRPDSDGGGMLGLPVRRQGRPGHHLLHGSAEVVFLDVSPALRLSPMGNLVARAGNVRDACVVSCVDWYGNARPIFLGRRVLALMGYELVEGALGQAHLQEQVRVSYLFPSTRP